MRGSIINHQDYCHTRVKLLEKLRMQSLLVSGSPLTFGYDYLRLRFYPFALGHTGRFLTIIRNRDKDFVGALRIIVEKRNIARKIYQCRVY